MKLALTQRPEQKRRKRIPALSGLFRQGPPEAGSGRRARNPGSGTAALQVRIFINADPLQILCSTPNSLDSRRESRLKVRGVARRLARNPKPQRTSATVFRASLLNP